MKLAILGCGVVGSEVIRIIDNLEVYQDSITIKKIFDKKPICDSRYTYQFKDILEDSEIDTIIETMGGLHPAYEFICASLKAHKNVVSANKAVIATYFKEFNDLAIENHVHFKIEASVGGGIPWIKELQRILRFDHILSFNGIMNGTTNFILDEMHQKDSDFDDILKEAQAKGYAEKDPSTDIEGYDIRNKCAITASIAYQGYLNVHDIPTLGISNIKKEDVQYFKSKGYICKLMGNSKSFDDSISLYVCPILTKNIEGHIHQNLNITSYTSTNLGKLQMIGQGAGGSPTASAIVSDIFDIYQNINQPFNLDKELSIQNNEQFHFYIRLPLNNHLQQDIALSYERDDTYTYLKTKKMTINEIMEYKQQDSFIAIIEE
ncbi:MAG: homoserine dehydrogenase [Traorella sp.]